MNKNKIRISNNQLIINKNVKSYFKTWTLYKIHKKAYWSNKTLNVNQLKDKFNAWGV